jgi:hypothetical protein
MKDDEAGDPSGEGFDPWFGLTGNTGSGTELIEETRRFGRGYRGNRYGGHGRFLLVDVYACSVF